MTNGMSPLRTARKARGWSMDKLAEVSGVSWRTIQRIETGRSDPHGPTRAALARALRTSVAELFPETEAA